MEYRKFSNNYVLRLDPKEEILETIKTFCLKEDIKLGTITGIGAVNDITVGLYDVDKKKYQSKDFQGNFEIVSLSGNITTKDDDCYLHLHLCVTDDTYKAFGGHLNRAIISATGEIFIHKIEGEVTRKFDDEIGLNLFQF